MYSFEEVMRTLEKDETAYCVYGELKGYELYYLEGELHTDEPDGTGYFLTVNCNDYIKYRDKGYSTI